MDKPLRALIVEDSEDDALLMIRELERSGYDTTFERVETAEAMTAALGKQTWDIILADYRLPHFSAPEALELLQQSGLNLPFIVISGEIGEETAVAIMKDGAHDYLMKDNLKRLVPAIERELHEAEVRKERKLVQEELQIAEQNFRNSLDSSPLGIRIVTTEGELLYANQTMLDIYGYSDVEELEATPTKKRYTPKSYAEHQERIQKRKQGKPMPASYEISIVRKDGEIRNLITSRKAVVWGGEVQYQVVYQDITERKRAEEQTKQLQEYLDLQIDRMPIALIVWDIEFRVQSWNPAAEKMFGFTAEEALGKHPYDLIVPKEAQPHVDNIWRRLLEGAMTAYSENITKDDRTIVCDWANTPLRGADGTVVGILSMVQDITERKQAEEQLRQSEEKYSTLVEQGNDGIIIIQDGLLKFANSKMVEMSGFSLEEVLDKSFIDFVSPEYKELVVDRFKKRMSGEEVPNNYEIAIFAKDGRKIPVEINASRIEYEGGFADMAIIRDITGRKKMEEQLIVTDRLASIGELASGIAHELNNPLTGVIGFSELLLSRDVPDDVKEDLKVINKEAQRTASVVRNLLVFARGHPQEKKSVDVNKIIENVLELRAYEQKVNNIQVDTRFASDLPEITADGFQLQQVFLNIIINAEHFMIEAHRRGTLTITTERAADFIRASFADDGPGVAQENLGHLFDPFFTTKEVGKGTGLGLSICHGIITDHGGRIYAESELGKGATFIVELPTLATDNRGKINENH